MTRHVNKDEVAVWCWLSSCHGIENAMAAPKIAEVTLIPERHVRRIIARCAPVWAKEYHVVILSKPGRGFYLATDAEEIAREHATRLRLLCAIKDRVVRFRQMVKGAGLGSILGRAA